MISCDTNVLFAVVNPDDSHHAIARRFIEGYASNMQFVLAEQVLVELYCLLRNPMIQKRPLSAAEAAKVITSIRQNPSWAIVDVPSAPSVMNEVWRRVAKPNFARRRIHDLRLALTLRHWGVDEFYTRNTKDFQDIGFSKLINPFDL